MRAPGVCRAGDVRFGPLQECPRVAVIDDAVPVRGRSLGQLAARRRSRRCSIRTARRCPTPGLDVAVTRSTRLRRPGPTVRSGSSSSTSRGRGASAAASATRCSSPPDSSCVGRSEQRGESEDQRDLLDGAGDFAVPRPRFSRPNEISARGVSSATWVSGSWNTVPASAAMRAGPCSRVSLPATVTRPAKSPP